MIELEQFALQRAEAPTGFLAHAKRWRAKRRHVANRAPFRAETKGKTLEISILGIIGGSWWSEGITAKGVKKALDSSPDAKEIRVLVDSPGGDVFDGIAIRSLFARHKANVIIEVIGEASSAASVICMGGDRVEMHTGAMMMIHRASTFAWGFADEIRTVADALDKIDESILDVYVEATEGEREEISKLVRAETWMTAKDAVARGFADEVVSGTVPSADDSEVVEGEELDDEILDSSENASDRLVLTAEEVALILSNRTSAAAKAESARVERIPLYSPRAEHGARAGALGKAAHNG
jgi:ATP-dependent Clp protease protease subunit